MIIDERVTPILSSPRNLRNHIARYNIAMGVCTNKVVMDLACGTGYGTCMLSWVAKEVLGVDIDEKAIKYAKENYNRKNLIYFNRNILDISYCGAFSDETREDYHKVDVIVSFETIEHIGDIELLQKTFLDKLKVGGIIVYSVPIDEKIENPYHKHKFTYETASRLFPDCQELSSYVQSGVNFYDETIPKDDKNNFFVSFKRKLCQK